MSRSSGGRSAVRTISGTPASSASTTAGWRLAAADPDVQRTAAGTPLDRAVPSAKNPALRSSSSTVTSIAGWRHRATASGVEREPGESTARLTPQRASSSTNAEARAVLRFVGSTGVNGRSAQAPGRKRVFVQGDAEAGLVTHHQEVAHERNSLADARREQALGGEAVSEVGDRPPPRHDLGGVRGRGY